MSVHFICGKPGGGKTLYSVKLILEEIMHGGRDIVTNVPLKLDAFNSYLQNVYPDAYKRYILDSGLTIQDRIVLIDEDDLKTFYLHRGRRLVLPIVSVVVDGKRDNQADYTCLDQRGVFYVLDEIHIAFNARAWASTGRSVLYYLSQHRKVGDDVICVTQAVGNVDRQFRSVAQDYTYVKNLSKVKLSLFRFPGIFWRSTYLTVPNDTTKPTEEGPFTLDINGIASLYDTAKGVGIHGRGGADTKARKKGLPFWALLVLIGIGLILVFGVLPKFLLYWLSPNRISHGKNAQVPELLEPSTNGLSGGTFEGYMHGLVPRVRSRDSVLSSQDDADVEKYVGGSAVDTNDVYCVGWSLLPGNEEVYFSDGTTAYESSREIQLVTPHWVFAFGKRYRVITGGSGSVTAGPRPVLSRVASGESVSAVVPSILPLDQPAESGTVEILPSIHGNFDGLPQPGRLNGFQGSATSTVQRGGAGQSVTGG